MDEKEMIQRLRNIRTAICDIDGLTDEQFMNLSFIIIDITDVIWALEDKAN